jgi:hypothetical protein
MFDQLLCAIGSDSVTKSRLVHPHSAAANSLDEDIQASNASATFDEAVESDFSDAEDGSWSAVEVSVPVSTVMIPGIGVPVAKTTVFQLMASDSGRGKVQARTASLPARVANEIKYAVLNNLFVRALIS